MAKKDFDKYYENYKGYYLSTLDMTNLLVQQVEEGSVTPEKLEEYKRDAEPIIQTFKMIQEFKRLIDRPARKSKIGRITKQTKRVIPASDAELDDLAKASEEAVNRLKDLVE